MQLQVGLVHEVAVEVERRVVGRIAALLRGEIEARVSSCSCSTVTPIWRHWSIRNTPTGVYGIATLRLVSLNVRFCTPASCSSCRASARDCVDVPARSRDSCTSSFSLAASS